MGRRAITFDGLVCQHGLGDKALATSGIGYCILQPTFFITNLFFQVGAIKGMSTYFGSSSKLSFMFGRRGVRAEEIERCIYVDAQCGIGVLILKNDVA